MSTGPNQVPVGDPKAVKKWSGLLFLQTSKDSYFGGRFIGEAEGSVIQRLTELEKDQGDTISFDLAIQLRGKPTAGDQRIEGKGEQLKFYTDTVMIDQVRHPVTSGGKMSRKRTIHDIRSKMKMKLGEYFARLHDEYLFCYLSGARGMNEDFVQDTDWTGHAGNAFQAPDDSHHIYASTATSTATLTTAMKFTSSLVEKAVAKSKMFRALDPKKANMQPVKVENGKHYIALINPWQCYDLRNADTTGWLEIQKAVMTAEGRKNPIFAGGLGMINNCIIHEHESVIRFNDWGSGSDVNGARALFLGAQAGVVAYGSASGLRFDWSEETLDHGNEVEIAAGFIGGMKKTRFNGADFGVISIDTAAADPNA